MHHRLFILYILFLTILPSTLSCDRNELTPVSEGITLTVSSPSFSVTKTGEGVDALNENVINSIYYFFYPTADGGEALPAMHGFYSGLSFSDSRTWNVPTSVDIINNQLFPVGTTTCRVVVVANPPSGIIPLLEGEPTLDSLRHTVINADFSSSEPQPNFVMVYDAVDTISSRSATVAMNIEAPVKRLANKITLHVRIKDSHHDDISGDWVPLPSQLTVSVSNCMNKANLCGDFSLLTLTEEDYSTSAELSFTDPVHDGSTHFYSCDVIGCAYTYPCNWTFASEHEPDIVFTLPWENISTHEQQTCYYRAVLSSTSFSSNNWLDITAELVALGSFYRETPTQEYLHEEYMIFPWNDAHASSEHNVNAEIREARYLMVEEKSFTLNNLDDWDIPYASSHECEITNATYITTNYATNPPQEIGPNPFSSLPTPCRIDLAGSIMSFEHTLRNDISGAAGTYDVAPYTFSFRIQHIDDHSYYEDITIVQYPALYITAEANTQSNSSGECYNSQGSNDNWSGSALWGTVYLNNSKIPDPYDNTVGHTTSDYNYTYHNQGYMELVGGNPQGGGLGSNHNGYMYVISTSATINLRIKTTSDSRTQATGSEYMIGDPRTQTVDNIQYNSQDWTAPSPALYDYTSSRKMKYHYPSSSTDDAAAVVSPKFRIASSWGTCNDMTWPNAMRRCAAYQEDGYPAGRWRVPTEAELLYIIKLSGDRVIPTLFGSLSSPSTGISYWCNNGSVTISTDGTVGPVFTRDNTSTTLHPVRCVYDDWYWENIESDNPAYETTGGRLPSTGTSPDYNKFVWGDMPR